MREVSQTYDPYTDERKVGVTLDFGVIATDAKEKATVDGGKEFALSQPEQVIDDITDISAKYATLEHNLFVLDGSFLLPPEDVSGEETGWISESYSDETGLNEFAKLTFTFSEPQSSKGFTIYFDTQINGNLPSMVTVTAETVDGEKTYTQGISRSPAIIDFPVENYSRLEFHFTNTYIPFRRVRVSEVVFGIVYHYDQKSIASLSYQNIVSPWCEKLPSSQVDLTIDNSDKTYNMITPDSIYRYLQDSQSATWSFIINGESVDMGKHYFTRAESEDGGLTSRITFNDWVYRLSDEETTGGANGTWTLEEALTRLLTDAGLGAVKFYGDVGSRVITTAAPQKTKLREVVRLAVQAARCTCFVDRDDVLYVLPADVKSAEEADRWTRHIQRSDAQIRISEYYNKVRLTVSNEYTETETVYESENIQIGEVPRILEVSNPLVHDGQAVADWILSWVQRRVSYEVSTRGNPALDILDTVGIDDVYNVNGAGMITELRYSYDGGLESTAKAIR